MNSEPWIGAKRQVHAPHARHESMNLVFMSKLSFNTAALGMSLPWMLKRTFETGQNFFEEIVTFKFSTVSERLITHPSSNARSSSVTYF
ncbi:unnamed protein product [Prorocentrum cordatum]|nr:unnamed protein product [Polarella glacialis]